MKERKVAKHYNLSKNLIDRIQTKSRGTFNTEVKAIEHYLKQGLEFEEIENLKEQIFSSLNQNINNIMFIKKLLIQLFVNKKFFSNREIKQDEAYNDFLENLFKDNFID